MRASSSFDVLFRPIVTQCASPFFAAIPNSKFTRSRYLRTISVKQNLSFFVLCVALIVVFENLILDDLFALNAEGSRRRAAFC